MKLPRWPFLSLRNIRLRRLGISPVGENKLLYLESIRGLAAFIVVLAHLHAAFFPYPDVMTDAKSPGSFIINGLFYGLPLGFVIAGHFAVIIFFVLSGYVLTIRYFEGRKIAELQKQAAKRFLRLFIPVFSTVLLAYFMLACGFMANIDALAQITGSPEAARIYNFEPYLTNALYDATIGVFANQSTVFNPVLWTMSVELFGSFIVFGLAILLGPIRKRWIFYVGAIILLSQTYFMPFIVGMALADAVQNTKLLEYSKKILNRGFIVFGIITVLVLASIPTPSIAVIGDLSQMFSLTGIDGLSSLKWWHVIGATLALWLVLSVPRLQQILSFRPFVWLGSISFAMYLLHYLILYSLGAVLFVWLWNSDAGLLVSAGISSLAVVVVTFGASELWKRYIDDTSVKASRLVAKYILR